VIYKISPSLKHSKIREYKYTLPWKNEEQSISFNNADVVSWFISLLGLIWYSLNKHWVANNIIGEAFCIQGVSLISLGSYQVGCILLGGLFVYDIFWVFGTDVMVTVAKSFDAPIKLLFPKNFLAQTYTFSMLGLGDIVIPGIFIALLLRYDVHRCRRLSIPDQTPYFTVTLYAYTIGLITTIFVMHTFQAAQPALLYLVPACVGASAIQSVLLGDFSYLISYEEKSKEEPPTSTDKNNNNKKNNSKEKPAVKSDNNKPRASGEKPAGKSAKSKPVRASGEKPAPSSDYQPAGSSDYNKPVQTSGEKPKSPKRNKKDD
jgi:minor histocompatibility antigen H13